MVLDQLLFLPLEENYEGINGFEPLLTSKFMMELSVQFLKNENGFRSMSMNNLCMD